MIEKATSSNPALDAASETSLKDVHPDLIRVVRRAAAESGLPFKVHEGKRSLYRQRELVARGASQTLNSRHLTGHAVDIVPVDAFGNVSWAWPLYYPLAKAIKAAAAKEKVALEWGGDWKKFKDGPHWQLPWNKYPAVTPAEVAKAPRATGVKEANLAKSRTVQGSAAAGAGGAVLLLQEGQKALEQAQGHITAGTWIGIAIASVILLGAAFAMYARWDDAGRPLPWKP